MKKKMYSTISFLVLLALLIGGLPINTFAATQAFTAWSGSVDISCKGEYELYVNGEFVSLGSGLDGSKMELKQADFRTGKNVVAIKVRGDYSAEAKYLLSVIKVNTGPSGFVNYRFATGTNTTAYTASAYNFDENWKAKSAGELTLFDKQDWMKLSFGDATWKNHKPYERLRGSDGNQFEYIFPELLSTNDRSTNPSNVATPGARWISPQTMTDTENIAYYRYSFYLGTNTEVPPVEPSNPGIIVPTPIVNPPTAIKPLPKPDTIKGTLYYKGGPIENKIEYLPLKNFSFYICQKGVSQAVADARTDENGNFTISNKFPNNFNIIDTGGDEIYLLIKASDPYTSNVYDFSAGSKLVTFTSQGKKLQTGTIDFGKIELDSNGAFNSVAGVRRAAEFWLKNTSKMQDIGKIDVTLRNDLRISHYDTKYKKIEIDLKEIRSTYGPDTIVHEYGHYLMDHFATIPYQKEEEMMNHTYTKKTSPEVAYSEGWAEYFALVANGTHTFSFQMETPGLTNLFVNMDFDNISVNIKNEAGQDVAFKGFEDFTDKNLRGINVEGAIVALFCKLENYINSLDTDKSDGVNEGFSKIATTMSLNKSKSIRPIFNIVTFAKKWYELGYAKGHEYETWKIFAQRGCEFDDEPPKILSIQPVNSMVSSDTVVQAEVTDNIKVARVEFIVSTSTGDKVVKTCTAPPFEYTIKPSDFETGNYTLKVRAYDARGDKPATSEDIDIKDSLNRLQTGAYIHEPVDETKYNHVSEGIASFQIVNGTGEIVSGSVPSDIAKIMEDDGYSNVTVNDAVIASNETAKTFQLPVVAGKVYNIRVDSSDGLYGLEIKRPDGTVYEKIDEPMSSQSIIFAGSTTGDWSVSVIPLNIPGSESTVRYGAGEKSESIIISGIHYNPQNKKYEISGFAQGCDEISLSSKDEKGNIRDFTLAVSNGNFSFEDTFETGTYSFDFQGKMGGSDVGSVKSYDIFLDTSINVEINLQAYREKMIMKKQDTITSLEGLQPQIIHLKNGAMAYYDDSVITYEDGSTSAMYITGQMASTWKMLGDKIKDGLGLPTSEEMNHKIVGITKVFTRYGIIYLGKDKTYGPTAVFGQIYEKYFAAYYPSSYDYLKQNQHYCDDGEGMAVDMESGAVYFYPGLGAYKVVGGIFKKWDELGREKSKLGYPIDDALVTATTKTQHFQNGYITLINNTAYVVTNTKEREAAIDDKAKSLPELGQSESSYVHVATGAYMKYQNGVVFYSDQDDKAYSIHGEIAKKWSKIIDNKTIPIGMPIGDEQYGGDGKRYSEFENGAIFETDRTGVMVIYGDIYNKWKTRHLYYGFPTSDQVYCSDGVGMNCRFETVVIYSKAGIGTYAIEYSHDLDTWIAMGAEKSILGYPISDLNIEDTKFQYGKIDGYIYLDSESHPIYFYQGTISKQKSLFVNGAMDQIIDLGGYYWINRWNINCSNTGDLELTWSRQNILYSFDIEISPDKVNWITIDSISQGQYEWEGVIYQKSVENFVTRYIRVKKTTHTEWDIKDFPQNVNFKLGLFHDEAPNFNNTADDILKNSYTYQIPFGDNLAGNPKITIDPVTDHLAYYFYDGDCYTIAFDAYISPDASFQDITGDIKIASGAGTKNTFEAYYPIAKKGQWIHYVYRIPDGDVTFAPEILSNPPKKGYIRYRNISYKFVRTAIKRITYPINNYVLKTSGGVIQTMPETYYYNREESWRGPEARDVANKNITEGIGKKWGTLNREGKAWLLLDLGAKYRINRWKLSNLVPTDSISLLVNNYADSWDDAFYEKPIDSWIQIDEVKNSTSTEINRSVVDFSTRYIMVYFENANNDPDVILSELELYYDSYTDASIGKTEYNKNIAEGKTTVASTSDTASGFTSDKAVNGIKNETDDMWSPEKGKEKNSWLTVDLGDFYKLSQWKVFQDSTNGVAKGYTLQAILKGQNSWRDIDTVTNNTSSISNMKTNEFEARYVRLLITDPGEATQIGIKEFEVFYSNANTTQKIYDKIAGTEKNGLNAYYRVFKVNSYSNSFPITKQMARIDTQIDLDFTKKQFEDLYEIDKNNEVKFYAYWLGYLKPKVSGDYKFYSNNPDMKVYINNQEVYPNTPITLDENQYYQIKASCYIEALNLSPYSQLTLFWESDKFSKEVVPAGCLYPVSSNTGTPAPVNNTANESNGLTAQYYSDDCLHECELIKTDSKIDFDLSLSENSWFKDHGSVRWEGTIKASETGIYKISKTGNKVSLWVDGTCLMLEDSNNATYGTVYMEAGKEYTIKITCRDTTKDVKLYWESSLKSKEVIPSENLVPLKFETVIEDKEIINAGTNHIIAGRFMPDRDYTNMVALVDGYYASDVEYNLNTATYNYEVNPEDLPYGQHTLDIVGQIATREVPIARYTINSRVPQLNIDNLENNQIVSGIITINGWAWAENNSAEKVELYRDGKYVGCASVSIPKPDITGHPELSGTNPNFQFVFDTQNLSVGVHELKFVLRTTNSNDDKKVYVKRNIIIDDLRKLKVCNINDSIADSVNIIQPLIEITNTGSVNIPLSSIKARYFFTDETGKAPIADIYYSSAGNDKTTTNFVVYDSTSPAKKYIEIGFNDNVAVLKPNEKVTVKVGIHASDYSYYSQTDDHSFINHTTLKENPKIVVALGDKIMWGQGPDNSIIEKPVPPSISVQYLSEDSSSETNMIKPAITIMNTGTNSINLSDVKVRYHYTNETTKPQICSIFWASCGNNNVITRFQKTSMMPSGTNYYIEYSFGPDAGILAPGSTVIIKSGVNTSDYMTYTQTNDHSFIPSAYIWTQNNNISGYIGNNLIWGTEPIVRD